MKNYRLVIDQSTSGTKLLLFENGQLAKRYDKAHRQIFPQSGWVEHDPLEIWHNVELLLNQALEENQLQAKQVASLSITNQRETIVAWDRITGKPLYNAIVWQCNRSLAICEELINEGKSDFVQAKTGLTIDSYFSGTKVKWLYDEVPAIAKKSSSGELAIGTIDSWLVWNLTQQHAFVTEPSNACRTLLYNIHTHTWDNELLALCGGAATDLPAIKDSSEIVGHYRGIPIQGIMADSQAALYGQGCLKSGEVKVTLGTGCSIMMQVEENDSYQDQRILTTIAQRQGTKTHYALEGIIRSCADSIRWFDEQVASMADSSTLCNQVLTEERQADVYFLPGLQGLGAPFWNNEATGAFIGLKRTTSKLDMLGAILDSIIFQVKAVIDVLELVSGHKISVIKIDGGVTRNSALVQQLANLLQKEIIVNDIEELSALGAMLLTGEVPEQPNLAGQQVVPQASEDLNDKYLQWYKLVNVVSALT
ncbi:FGGY-family carbohydrate kinase [Enterococcus sp. AZ163]|uniref:FGGY-family carbohydrate kinase n=1 Tax=Enterococcus sp. AZ163 TaxID=2774638 RepID=UPI003D2BF3E1